MTWHSKSVSRQEACLSSLGNLIVLNLNNVYGNDEISGSHQLNCSLRRWPKYATQSMTVEMLLISLP